MNMMDDFEPTIIMICFVNNTIAADINPSYVDNGFTPFLFEAPSIALEVMRN